MTPSVASPAGRSFTPVSPDRLPVLTAKRQRLQDYCKKLYGDRVHWTGVPLVEHAQGVLRILEGFRPDDQTVTACLLQHVLRTRAVGLPELEEEFGVDVRGLVSNVHLLSHVTMRSTRIIPPTCR